MIKRNFLGLAFIFLFYMQVSTANPLVNISLTPGFTIQITSDNLPEKHLYLSRRVSGNWINLDSALIMPGTPVHFEGSLDAPEVLHLRLENSGKTISFFAENSTIEIIPDFEITENTKVTGSTINDEYQMYLSSMNDLNQQKNEAYKLYTEANRSGDKARKEEAIKTFDQISSLEMERNKKFVLENKGSWISPYIIRTSMSYTLNLEELKSLVYQLENKIDASIYVKQLKDHIDILDKVDIGKGFTEFQLPTPEGDLLSLSDLAGRNYMLIDFWASWCGPCRRENPNVVALYNDFKDKGFDILGVSFDTNRENWLKAIEDDKLIWHQVSDLRGWASAAGKLYGINSIPHTILLDPDGVIIAKNLSTEELREKLTEFLLK